MVVSSGAAVYSQNWIARQNIFKGHRDCEIGQWILFETVLLLD